MVDTTRELIDVMKGTGEGIVRHEEVNEALNNEFVNKWCMYSVHPTAPQILT